MKHRLLTSFQATAKPILIYPNSGESYDADRKEWVVSSSLSVNFTSK